MSTGRFHCFAAMGKWHLCTKPRGSFCFWLWLYFSSKLCRLNLTECDPVLVKGLEIIAWSVRVLGGAAIEISDSMGYSHLMYAKKKALQSKGNKLLIFFLTSGRWFGKSELRVIYFWKELVPTTYCIFSTVNTGFCNKTFQVEAANVQFDLSCRVYMDFPKVLLHPPTDKR